MASSIEEVLTSISGRLNDEGEVIPNRFNRRNFNKLVEACMSDPTFKAEVAIIKDGKFQGYDEVPVGEMIRKWLKNIVEMVGIDPFEAKVVESESFSLGNTDWMYHFFAEVLWLFLEGNKFDLLKKETFDVSLYLKTQKAGEAIKDVRVPGQTEVIGQKRIKKPEYIMLKAKSKCPDYMVEKEEV